MAPTRRTMAEVLHQKAYLQKVGDQRTRDLVVAWARAWDEIEADLERTLQAIAEARASGATVERLRRQRQALQIVSEQLLAVLTDAQAAVTADARHLIEKAAGDTDTLIRSQLPNQRQAPATVSLQRADAGQIQQIVNRTTQQITARHVQLHLQAQVAVRRQIMRAVAVGDSPRDAARRMLASVQGEFEGGLTRALVIARTEQIDAYRAAATVQQAANADVLVGWRWSCTLSARTCPSCLSHHGELHPMDEPGPLDHQQGRCARVPVTKSWRDLGFDLDEPPGVLNDGDGMRWFQQQPATVQQQILGPKRFDAWQAGDYPPDQWSQRVHTPGWRDSYRVGPVSRADGS